MEKYKFDSYEVELWNREPLHILVPRNIDKTWCFCFNDWEYGTDMMGDEKGLRDIMMSFAVLANYPDKVIYFPVKNNSAVGAEGFESIEVDVLFTTHNVAMRRKDWKMYRKLIRKQKPSTYTFCYEKERFDQYVEKFWQRKLYPEPDRAKRCVGYHKLHADTVFIVADKICFLEGYMSMLYFMDEDLDTWFVEGIGVPYRCAFFYPIGSRTRMGMWHRYPDGISFEVYYHNEKLLEERREYQRKMEAGYV